MMECDLRGHNFDSEDGYCLRCGDEDPDWEDEDDEEEEEEDDGWVDKDWNGRFADIEVEVKWLLRAKELLLEHKIIHVEDAHIIVPILEREAGCQQFDEDIARTVVVALRETKDVREALAMADVPTIPEETTGGKGLLMLRAIALREKQRRGAALAAAICQIPDCGCSGLAHP